MKKICVLASMFGVGLALVHAPACLAAGATTCAIPTPVPAGSSALLAQPSPLMSQVTDADKSPASPVSLKVTDNLPPASPAAFEPTNDKSPAAPISLTTYCYCQIHCSNGGGGSGWTELVECAQIFATCCNNSGSWSCT